MTKIKFQEKDWEEIYTYLKQWDDWRRNKKVGRPDFTSDAIYQIPFVIASIESGKKIERLTWILVGLTVVLVVLTIVLIVR